MQKWILVYTTSQPKEHTTFFEASSRSIAEIYVNIYFRMLMGTFLRPEIIRSQWVSGEKLGFTGEKFKENNKVFEGSFVDKTGGKHTFFRGFLYKTKEFESRPNDTDKTLIDRLKLHTDLPPI